MFRGRFGSFLEFSVQRFVLELQAFRGNFVLQTVRPNESGIA